MPRRRAQAAKRRRRRLARARARNSNRESGPRAAPAAQTTIMPRASTPLDRIRLRHREFICDLSGTTDFTVSNLGINPGLEAMFPWLSTLANNFETYEFHRLQFHYVPSCSTSTTGSLLIAPDYDPKDDNSGASKATLLTFQDSVRGAWWTGAVCKCSSSNLHRRDVHYIRSGMLSGEHDIKTYDVGTLWVGTQSSSTDVLGELWVDYDVTLMTPQREPPSHGMIGHNFDHGASVEVSQTTPFGQVAVPHDHFLGSESHLDYDLFEFRDVSGDGYVDSIAFRSAGKFLLNWIIDGINTWTVDPLASLTSADIHQDGTSGCTLNSLHAGHNVAGNKANALYEIEIKPGAFQHTMSRYDDQENPADKLPYLRFGGNGTYTATQAIITLGRAIHHRFLSS